MTNGLKPVKLTEISNKPKRTKRQNNLILFFKQFCSTLSQNILKPPNERNINMEQYNLEALKTKRAETLTSVKIQSTNLKAAKEHVTYIDAQLCKVQKRYELLDRKIFEMEHEERIAQERIAASEKTTKKRSTKQSSKAKLSAKLNNILADMTEEQLKALIAKHI